MLFPSSSNDFKGVVSDIRILFVGMMSSPIGVPSRSHTEQLDELCVLVIVKSLIFNGFQYLLNRISIAFRGKVEVEGLEVTDLFFTPVPGQGRMKIFAALGELVVVFGKTAYATAIGSHVECDLVTYFRAG